MGAPISKQGTLEFFKQVYAKGKYKDLTKGWVFSSIKSIIEVVIITNVGTVLDNMFPIQIHIFNSGPIRFLKAVVKSILPAICTYPLDTIYLRNLQIEPKENEERGYAALVRKMWDMGEIKSLYSGFSLEVLFRFSSNVVACIIFPLTRYVFLSEHPEFPHLNLINQILVMGILYPIDSLKRKVQGKTNMEGVDEDKKPEEVTTMNPYKLFKESKDKLSLWNGYSMFITYSFARIYGTRLGARFFSMLFVLGNQWLYGNSPGPYDFLHDVDVTQMREKHIWANKYV